MRQRRQEHAPSRELARNTQLDEKPLNPAGQPSVLVTALRERAVTRAAGARGLSSPGSTVSPAPEAGQHSVQIPAGP